MENKDKNILIYKLEIAYNEETGTIEYITECISESEDRGPIDTNFDHLDDFFDEEDMKLLDKLYIVGES